nr:porin family protein [uncultured Psychroserpens sp.]
MKTRHFSLFLSMLLFCYTHSFSQNDNSNDTPTNPFRFAVKGGINFSNNYGDVESSESFLADFHIGAIVTIPTNLDFNIQVEPQLSRVGSANDGKTIKRFTLFDIPILAQIHTVKNWSFEIGPKMAITLDQKQRRNEALETVERLKTITIGFVGGATYNFDDNLFSQFRINYSPSDVIKKDAGDTEGTSILLFQLSVGYWLN